MKSVFGGTFWAPSLFDTTFLRGEPIPAGSAGHFFRGTFWAPSLFDTTFFRGEPVAPVPVAVDTGEAAPPSFLRKLREEREGLVLALSELDD